MGEALVLSVSQTWDGTPLSSRDGARVAISAHQDSWIVEVEAMFHADPPPPGLPGPHPGLWNYEVVELFVVAADSLSNSPKYTEIELSPHGHYLILRLEGVRNPVATLEPLEFTALIEGDRWRGRVVLPRTALPPAPHVVNAFAIWGSGRQRTYAAAFPVPGGEPDFHRLSEFPRLEIPHLASPLDES